MAAADKDIHQKTKAIRFCLATGLVPFYEVKVSNIREIADVPTLLTDIDVLGVAFQRNSTSRTIFDCKTNSKTSPINRAFWAAGLMQYAGAENAYVILNKAAPEGHKLSSKVLGVHLFDEPLFESHASALSLNYRDMKSYASNIDNWHALHAAFKGNAKLEKLGEFLFHVVPLEPDPAKALRGILAHIKQARGELDPARPAHMAIYTYCVFSLAFAIAPIVRDIFDVFDPKQAQGSFEKLLRAYVWGGREAYLLRKKLQELMAERNENVAPEIELGAWENFVEMSRTFLDAPDEVPNCCIPLLELSLRYVATQEKLADIQTQQAFIKTRRVRQFCFRLADYLVESANLPRDFSDKSRGEINAVMDTIA